MSYLWQEFNIKTFPSETLVFQDNVFCEDLSDYKNVIFDSKTRTISTLKTPKLPIHIIYIGEIHGNIDLKIDIPTKNTDIFVTVKITNKKPAFLNFFVKNTGNNSSIKCQIIAENHDNLKIYVTGCNSSENTGIFVKTRVFAYKDSETILNGYANIDKKLKNCDSDISFSVMAEESAKITMKPAQYINSIPKSATHSASIYHPNENQINYLRESGLSGKEISNILKEAFLAAE